MNCYIQLRGGNKLLIIIDGVRSQVLQKSSKSKIYHFLRQFSKCLWNPYPISTWHYCRGKKFGQFTRKCFSNDTFWLPLPIMSKGSRGSLWEYTKFKIKMVKSMPLFRQWRLKTIFFGTVRSYIAYMRVPPSLPYPLPSTTTSSTSTLPSPLWIVRLNKFNVKILSAWIAVFSTRLRTEKKGANE